jgi:hypothetical protein
MVKAGWRIVRGSDGRGTGTPRSDRWSRRLQATQPEVEPFLAPHTADTVVVNDNARW